MATPEQVAPQDAPREVPRGGLTPPPTAPAPDGSAAGPVVAGIAVAAGGAAAAQGAAVVAALPAKAVRKITGEAVALLRRFARSRSESVVPVLVTLLRREFPERSEVELLRLVRHEQGREREFLARMARRLRQDLPEALAHPDPAARLERVRAITDRERRFIDMRERAMAERAVGAAQWQWLSESSPEGAVWMLGPARSHTAECLALAGKALPHEVLEVWHPPLHAGCRCWLMPLADAVRRGDSDGVVPDPESAMAMVRQIMLRHTHGGVGAEEPALSEAPLVRGATRVVARQLRWDKGFVRGGQFRARRGSSARTRELGRVGVSGWPAGRSRARRGAMSAEVSTLRREVAMAAGVERQARRWDESRGSRPMEAPPFVAGMLSDDDWNALGAVARVRLLDEVEVRRRADAEAARLLGERADGVDGWRGATWADGVLADAEAVAPSLEWRDAEPRASAERVRDALERRVLAGDDPERVAAAMRQVGAADVSAESMLRGAFVAASVRAADASLPRAARVRAEAEAAEALSRLRGEVLAQRARDGVPVVAAGSAMPDPAWAPVVDVPVFDWTAEPGASRVVDHERDPHERAGTVREFAGPDGSVVVAQRYASQDALAGVADGPFMHASGRGAWLVLSAQGSPEGVGAALARLDMEGEPVYGRFVGFGRERLRDAYDVVSGDAVGRSRLLRRLVARAVRGDGEAQGAVAAWADDVEVAEALDARDVEWGRWGGRGEPLVVSGVGLRQSHDGFREVPLALSPRVGAVRDFEERDEGLGVGVNFRDARNAAGYRGLDLEARALYHPADASEEASLRRVFGDVAALAASGADFAVVEDADGARRVVTRESVARDLPAGVQRGADVAFAIEQALADGSATTLMQRLGWDGVDGRGASGVGVLYAPVLGEGDSPFREAQGEESGGPRRAHGVGRWVFIRGSYRHVPRDKDWREEIVLSDGRRFVFDSPAGGTAIFREALAADGSVAEAREKVSAAGMRSTHPDVRRPGRGGTYAEEGERREQSMVAAAAVARPVEKPPLETRPDPLGEQVPTANVVVPAVPEEDRKPVKAEPDPEPEGERATAGVWAFAVDRDVSPPRTLFGFVREVQEPGRFTWMDSGLRRVPIDAESVAPVPRVGEVEQDGFGWALSPEDAGVSLVQRVESEDGDSPGSIRVRYVTEMVTGTRVLPADAVFPVQSVGKGAVRPGSRVWIRPSSAASGIATVVNVANGRVWVRSESGDLRVEPLEMVDLLSGDEFDAAAEAGPADVARLVERALSGGEGSLEWAGPRVAVRWDAPLAEDSGVVSWSDTAAGRVLTVNPTLATRMARSGDEGLRRAVAREVAREAAGRAWMRDDVRAAVGEAWLQGKFGWDAEGSGSAREAFESAWARALGGGDWGEFASSHGEASALVFRAMRDQGVALSEEQDEWLASWSRSIVGPPEWAVEAARPSEAAEFARSLVGSRSRIARALQGYQVMGGSGFAGYVGLRERRWFRREGREGTDRWVRLLNVDVPDANTGEATGAEHQAAEFRMADGSQDALSNRLVTVGQGIDVNDLRERLGAVRIGRTEDNGFGGGYYMLPDGSVTRVWVGFAGGNVAVLAALTLPGDPWDARRMQAMRKIANTDSFKGRDASAARQALHEAGWRLQRGAAVGDDGAQVLDYARMEGDAILARRMVVRDGVVAEFGLPDDVDGSGVRPAGFPYEADQGPLRDALEERKERLAQARDAATEALSAWHRTGSGNVAVGPNTDALTVTAAIRLAGWEQAGSLRELAGGKFQVTYKNARGTKIAVTFVPENGQPVEAEPIGLGASGWVGTVTKVRVTRSAREVLPERLSRPAHSLSEFNADLLARADAWAEEHGAVGGARISEVEWGAHTGYGFAHWDAQTGRIAISRGMRDRAEAAFRRLRDGGDAAAMTPADRSAVYMAYRTAAHEALHSINAGQSYARADGSRGVEEALTEESASLLATEWLRDVGLGATTEWAAQTGRDAGTYHLYRAGLARYLREAGVPREQWRDEVFRLTFREPADGRLEAMQEALRRAGSSVTIPELFNVDGSSATPEFSPVLGAWMPGWEGAEPSIVAHGVPVGAAVELKSGLVGRVVGRDGPVHRVLTDDGEVFAERGDMVARADDPGSFGAVSGRVRVAYWDGDVRREFWAQGQGARGGAVEASGIQTLHGWSIPRREDGALEAIDISQVERDPATGAMRVLGQWDAPPSGHLIAVRDRSGSGWRLGSARSTYSGDSFTLADAPGEQFVVGDEWRAVTWPAAWARRDRMILGSEVDVSLPDGSSVGVRLTGDPRLDDAALSERGEVVWLVDAEVEGAGGEAFTISSAAGMTPTVRSSPAVLAVNGVNHVVGVNAVVRGRITGQLSIVRDVPEPGRLQVERRDGTTGTFAVADFEPVLVLRSGHVVRVGEQVRMRDGEVGVLHQIDWSRAGMPRAVVREGADGSGPEYDIAMAQDELVGVAGDGGEAVSMPPTATLMGDVTVGVGSMVRLPDGRQGRILGRGASAWPWGDGSIEVETDGEVVQIAVNATTGVPRDVLTPVGVLPPLPATLPRWEEFRAASSELQQAVETDDPDRAAAAHRAMSAYLASVIDEDVYRRWQDDREAMGEQRPSDLIHAVLSEYEMPGVVEGAAADVARALIEKTYAPIPGREAEWTDVPAGTMADEAVQRFCWSRGNYGSRGFTTTIEAFGPSGVSGKVVDANGRKVGEFQRSVRVGADGSVSIYHALLSLTGSARGTGFAVDFNGHAMEVYRAKGVKHVTVSPGLSHGPTTWAIHDWRFAIQAGSREDYHRKACRGCYDWLVSAKSLGKITEDEYDQIKGRFWNGSGEMRWDAIWKPYDVVMVDGQRPSMNRPTLGTRILSGNSWPYQGAKVLDASRSEYAWAELNDAPPPGSAPAAPAPAPSAPPESSAPPAEGVTTAMAAELASEAAGMAAPVDLGPLSEREVSDLTERGIDAFLPEGGEVNGWTVARRAVNAGSVTRAGRGTRLVRATLTRQREDGGEDSAAIELLLTVNPLTRAVAHSLFVGGDAAGGDDLSRAADAVFGQAAIDRRVEVEAALMAGREGDVLTLGDTVAGWRVTSVRWLDPVVLPQSGDPAYRPVAVRLERDGRQESVVLSVLRGATGEVTTYAQGASDERVGEAWRARVQAVRLGLPAADVDLPAVQGTPMTRERALAIGREAEVVAPRSRVGKWTADVAAWDEPVANSRQVTLLLRTERRMEALVVRFVFDTGEAAAIMPNGPGTLSRPEADEVVRLLMERVRGEGSA